jgi:hypothetical protein
MAFVLAAALATTGCRIESNKNGDNKDVKIATPFGGMQVKTNDDAVPSDLGLPTYPGATLVKKNSDHDGGSADVNMSFGSFQMRVKAASYHTTDGPEKVEAFYRDSLRHYGDVIACRNNHSVGEPSRTGEGLTCDSNHGNHISMDEQGGKGKLDLKAGSQPHQHVVGIEPDGSGGTKFGLVALDLPGRLFSKDSDDKGGDRQ